MSKIVLILKDGTELKDEEIKQEEKKRKKKIEAQLTAHFLLKSGEGIWLYREL